MMKAMISLVIVALSVVGLSTAPAFAQGGRYDVEFTREISWDGTPFRTVTLTTGVPITVVANNVGQDDTVAVKAVSGITVLRARGWLLTYSGSRRPANVTRLQTITKLASSAATWSNNTFTVNGGVVPDTRVGLQFEVPTGTTVTLYVNGKLVKSGAVNNSFMTMNGSVVSCPEGLYDAPQVLVRVATDINDVDPVNPEVSCGWSLVLGCAYRICTGRALGGNRCADYDIEICPGVPAVITAYYEYDCYWA